MNPSSQPMNWFGLKMEIDFALPENGRTKAAVHSGDRIRSRVAEIQIPMDARKATRDSKVRALMLNELRATREAAT